jgi:chemotaxis protein MotA
MFAIIGLVIVFGCIIGGYTMEHGNLHVLFQPAELVIIFGAAIGAFVVANPTSVLKASVKGIIGVFTGKGNSKEYYLDALSLLYDLFTKMRREGMLGIENDIEYPTESELFKKHPALIHNHAIISFICDNLKLFISGAVEPMDFENLMEMEIEAIQHHALEPSHSVTSISDSLPGLGIVAAVLGIVVTMGKISEPPEVLGESIAAALVGTFLGILMCYGIMGPLCSKMTFMITEKMVLFQIIKVSFMSYFGGAQPQMAVEFGRRAVPEDHKPSFSELEAFLRKGKA